MEFDPAGYEQMPLHQVPYGETYANVEPSRHHNLYEHCDAGPLTLEGLVVPSDMTCSKNVKNGALHLVPRNEVVFLVPRKLVRK